MNKKIPKYWSNGFKRLTGLDATYDEYVKHPNIFKPETLYDENPLTAWIVFISLGVVIISGIITVFFN